MSISKRLPTLFIASAAESLAVAEAIQSNLEFDFEATIWNQAVFTNALPILSHLEAAIDDSDFAVFVFSPDDKILRREKEIYVTRDNVIFEYGFSLALLGPHRNFIVKPHGIDITMPSDLAGTSTISYLGNRRDGNMMAALGPACSRLKEAGRKLGPVERIEKATGNEKRSFFNFDDYISAWESEPLLSARSAVRSISLDPYSEEFNAVRPQFLKIFSFLDSLSTAILEHQVVEEQAKLKFGTAIISFWPVAATMLAPPNGWGDLGIEAYKSG